MSWYRAKSLDTYVNEINKLAPKRNKRSDGWVGDTSHQARKSDHNPDWGRGGVVRAQDITHDPKGGLDCNKLAKNLAAQLGRHPALGSGAYIIWNRRIISTDRLREGWRRYTGSNGHTQHLHLSVGQRNYNSTAGFGLKPGVVEKAVKKVNGKYPVSLSAVRKQAKAKKPTASAHVRRVQKALVRAGMAKESYLKPDGFWGPRTTEVYRKWQKQNGFRTTGVPKIGSFRKLVKTQKHYIYVP